MFKKSLMGLALCLAISGSAMAAVSEKVETGDKFNFTYPVFSFDSEKATTKTNNFVAKQIKNTAKLLENPVYRDVSTNYQLFDETDKYVSFTFTTANYTGGAHGMYYTRGVVFDKETGKRLPYTEFAPKISAKQLKEDILNGKLNVFTSDLKTKTTAPFLKDTNNFKVSKDFVIDKDQHVYLIYQPYELDCYAAGETYVQIK